MPEQDFLCRTLTCSESVSLFMFKVVLFCTTFMELIDSVSYFQCLQYQFL